MLVRSSGDARRALCAGGPVITIILSECLYISRVHWGRPLCTGPIIIRAAGLRASSIYVQYTLLLGAQIIIIAFVAMIN
jgi:hypothetical protein